ncbi:hypothetical protein EEW87_17190 [Janibacter melonis]|uniref:Biopolymer transporter Tol n=1 Tax=Janibacter melonis TaxID=262209 RepID=A0A650GEE9_9MICO|nr:hypothetical protein [Janibacter melonis]MCB5991993.1 hypothetical protein [Janibacter melonis]QGX08626.1 hypothetical protein EEW87_17190 [Janibacter melonis]
MSEPDEHFFVVDGRRWRREDPHLPSEVAEELRSHLGRARSAIGRAGREGTDPAPYRARVSAAKHGLGERGTPWWEQDDDARRQRYEQALQTLRTDDDPT